MSSDITGRSLRDDACNVLVVLNKLTKEEILSWKTRNISENTELPISIDIPNVKIEPQEQVQIREESTEITQITQITQITEITETIETIIYNCNVCNKNYNDWEKLLLHKYIKHNNNLPYKCGICDEAFVVNDHLDRHLLKHVDYQRTMTSVTIQSSTRNNAFNEVPTKWKPFKCTNCLFGTKSEEKFSYHITVCDKAPEDIIDTKPNVCSLCFKNFLTESQLNQHMQYHPSTSKLNLQVNNTPTNQTISSSNEQTLKSLRNRSAKTKDRGENMQYHPSTSKLNLQVNNTPTNQTISSSNEQTLKSLRNRSAKTKDRGENMQYHPSTSKLNLQVNNTPTNQTNSSNNEQTLKSLRHRSAKTKDRGENMQYHPSTSKLNLQVNNTPTNQTNSSSNEQTLKSLRNGSAKTKDRGENNFLKLPTTKCQWCESIITERNLLRHIKTQHPQVKPFKCTYCSVKFKYLPSKKEHILKCHKTKKN